ncbi:MAG: hypothetical protein JNK82_03530, partial [Myxococcaceae bacterium]|nr:hypothetical protein [Myxococcaceae bacterium]
GGGTAGGGAAGGGAAGGGTAGGSSSSGGNLFVANFADLNANGSNVYNFASRYANNMGGQAGGGSDGNQNWLHTHLPNGGPNGGPAAHLSMFQGRLQYPMGWTTPNVGGTWALGDEIFFRFAIRYDDGFQFAPSWRNKFILHGRTGGSTQSRIVTYMNTRTSNLGACLGWQNYVVPPGGNYFPFSLPAHFGLVGDNQWSNFGSQYGSIGVHVNIGWTAAGPLLVTAGDAASPPAPGPGSQAPAGGWYYGQIAARSGLNGNSRFRLWMNNNNLANPTVTQTVWHDDPSQGIRAELGVEGWSEGSTLGGYVDVAPPQRQGFRIAAYEVGTQFRSDWFPG